MDRTEVLRRRDELSGEYGAWHDNIPLGDGLYTISTRGTREHVRLKSILQAAVDAVSAPLEQLRVLDLGAAEGAFAVEFALHGANVVAFEGREANVEKIRLARDALELERLTIVHADVRELSRAAHGEFDLVLCLGLLYHLEAASAVALAHQLSDVCRRVAVIDTHIGFKPKHATTIAGHTYSGRVVREFDPGSPEQQDRLTRVSIGNPESIWLTRASLFNLLDDAGFTTVTEIHVPRHEKNSDRVTLLAFKGSPRKLASAPAEAEPTRLRWPEQDTSTPHPNQTLLGELKRRLAPWTPGPLKRWVVARQERRRP